MFEKILNSAALILSVVNGLMLLFFYLRDKPKLIVKPIHSDLYQWWFKLSDGVQDNKPTKRYGFFSYLAISNKGLRDVSMTSWHLIIKLRNFTKYELSPTSIPEPTFKLANINQDKILPVLGIKGLHHNGETNIKSGASISGIACYIFEFRGSDAWDILIEDDKIKATIIVNDVFDKSTTSEIVFTQKSTEEIENAFPTLLKIQ